MLAEYGWAGFFAFIYLGTVGMFIRVLLKDRKDLVASLEEERKRSERIAGIIEKGASADERLTQAMNELSSTVRDEVAQSRETMAYWKGKDEQRGRR